MIDRLNPTSQFHPYRRETSVPVSEREPRGLSAVLNGLGLLDDAIEKIRDYARSNPGKVLGGLAAIVIGASLIRKRARATASDTYSRR